MIAFPIVYDVLEIIADTLQLAQVVANGSVGKSEVLVETMSQYRLAPVTALHANVAFLETLTAVFTGRLGDGAGNSAGAAEDGVEHPALLQADIRYQ